jgi:drug/metabolite transporter (DMT)-like permease
MRPTPIASVAVVAVGALWGLYWLPLRHAGALAPIGPWLTAAVLVVACLVLAPAAWLGRQRLLASSWRALGSIALGGAAFTLYSDGLLYGHVAVVILMFYLTPVWSTLIARFWLRRPITWWRYAAIALGLGGIALVLNGGEGDLPLPHRLGDWLGLLSGLLWAIASTGIHTHARGRPAETNFLFCLGALACAAPLALVLGRDALVGIEPEALGPALAWIAAIGVGWWAVSLSLFMWATQALEPPRVGILLMSEVIVGVVSAAVLAAEPFGPQMAVGTVLVVGAGLLETLPDRHGGYPAAAPPG